MSRNFRNVQRDGTASEMWFAENESEGLENKHLYLPSGTSVDFSSFERKIRGCRDFK